MSKILKAVGFVCLCLGMAYLDLIMLREIYKLVLIPLGAPAITLLQTFGVFIFIQAMSSNKKSKHSEEQEEKDYYQDHITKCTENTLNIAIGLLIAYLIF